MKNVAKLWVANKKNPDDKKIMSIKDYFSQNEYEVITQSKPLLTTADAQKILARQKV